jgi:hypothetical protein
MALLRSKIADIRLQGIERVNDPRFIAIMEEMNEQMQAFRKTFGEVVMQMNEIADLIGSQQTVLEHMKPVMRRAKELGIAVGSDPSITGEHDE